jgi:hypothetical protein
VPNVQAIEPSYRYGDLTEGLRRLTRQVRSVNHAREQYAFGLDGRPRATLIDLQKAAKKYANKWLRFYGFNDKYARIPPKDQKNVELALRVIEEGKS